MDFTQFINLDFIVVEILVVLISSAIAFAQRELIDRIVNHEKYAIALKVFARIDPMLENALKGDAQFAYDELKAVIREVATTGLSEARVDAIAQYISKKFDLLKVLR